MKLFTKNKKSISYLKYSLVTETLLLTIVYTTVFQKLVRFNAGLCFESFSLPFFVL